MINSSNYADMTDALRIQWLDAFNSQSGLDVVKQLYKVETADGLTGYISSLDGFSTARRKDEGDDLPYLNLNQNYRKTWTTYTVGGMEKITWEMSFSLFPPLATMVKKLLKLQGHPHRGLSAAKSERRGSETIIGALAFAR